MSQRGTGNRPLSRASSRSPPSPRPPAPTPSAPVAPGNDAAPANPSVDPRLASSPADGRPRSSQHSRPSVVHAILNPADPQPPGPGASWTFPRDPGPQPPLGRHGRVLSGPPLPHPPFAFYRGEQSTSSPPSLSPRTKRTLPSLQSLDRGSPTIAPPRSALNSPGAVASPRASRAQSLHIPTLRSGETPNHPAAISSSFGTKRPYEGDAGPPTTGPPLQQGLAYPTTVQPFAVDAALRGLRAATPRALSQPLTQQQHPLQPPYAEESGQPGPWQQPPPYAAEQYTMWDSRAGIIQGPASSAPHKALPSWAPAIEPQRQPPFPEAAAAAVNLVPPANRLLVEIDTHSGSRQAKYKRQRNAEASANFRDRKRTKDLNLAKRVEQLEAHAQELEQQRDFYKGDRNRLRDLLLRMGVSEAVVAGPPTPPMTTVMAFHPGAAGVYPEPGGGGTPARSAAGAVQAGQGYLSSESSSVERPRRKRRTGTGTGTETGTGTRSQASPLTYAQPRPGVPPPGPGAALPPITGAIPGYGMPPSRPTSTSSASETLPPLRGIEGPPPPHHGDTSGPPGTAAYYSLPRATYEAGWVNRPAAHGPEPGQR